MGGWVLLSDRHRFMGLPPTPQDTIMLQLTQPPQGGNALNQVSPKANKGMPAIQLG